MQGLRETSLSRSGSRNPSCPSNGYQHIHWLLPPVLKKNAEGKTPTSFPRPVKLFPETFILQYSKRPYPIYFGENKFPSILLDCFCSNLHLIILYSIKNPSGREITLRNPTAVNQDTSNPPRDITPRLSWIDTSGY